MSQNLTRDGIFQERLFPASKRHRLLVWLLISSGLIPLILVMIALSANTLSTQTFHDVDVSGSLRFRCLWIYGVTRGGSGDIQQQLAAMNGIRGRLRERYPSEVAATDSAWAALSGSLHRTGTVDWDTANAARASFDRLTAQIEAKESATNRRVAILFGIGCLGLCASLAASLRLLKGRQQAEAALSAERNFQTALLESLQEGIVACDAQGTLIHFNRATREFHGLPPVPIPPDQWAEHFDLYGADGSEQLTTRDIPLFRALQGECVQNTEMVIAPRNGMTRTLLANGQAIYGTEGEKLGAVVAMHDITLRRQTEREMARLAAIVENSDEAISVFNLDGILVSWNSGAARLYGHSADEVIGQHASVLALPGEVSFVPQVAASAKRGEAILPKDVRHRRKDGVLVDLSLSFSLVRDLAGTVIGVSVISRDVTAQKRAEVALAESEDRLRRLCEAAFEGICISQNGVIIDANPAFASLFGFAGVAEAVGVPATDLSAPKYRELIRERINQGVETTYEAVCRRIDGTTFPVEIRGRIAVWNGQTARVTAIRDLTARTAMEEALHVSDTRFRTAVDAMEEGLVLQNQTGAILMCNGSAERILELSADQLMGRDSIDPRWQAIHEDGSDFPGPEHPAMVALRTGLPQNDIVMGIRKPSGKLTWVSVNAVPLFVADEERPSSVVVTFGDITERMRTEERFRVLFEESSDAHLLVADGGILDCNRAMVTMLRCHDKAQVLSLHPGFLSPEYQPDGRRSDEKCFEMEELARLNGMHRFEWIHHRMDGEQFPVEVTLTPVTLQAEPVMLAVWHDLTERKIAEQQVHDLALALQSQKEQLERTNAELEALATTDGLTGLKNHRCFQERLVVEIRGAIRYQTPLSVILLDVDRFKSFNDAFGHPAGDTVLRQVADVLQEQSRVTDVAARYGGEEFILLLPQTDSSGALVIAERIRTAIEAASWPLRSITASFGVASLDLTCEHEHDLIARADRALYQSKGAGRNRVTHDSQPVFMQAA